MKKSMLAGILVVGLLVGLMIYLFVPAFHSTDEETTVNDIPIPTPTTDSSPDTTPSNSDATTPSTTPEDTSSGSSSPSDSETTSDSDATTDISPSGPMVINLGTAGNFVILSKAGISTTGVTSIVGDMGVSPIDHTSITGFALIGESTTDTFLTSSLVTGKIYASNLVSPTPVEMTTAISDMETAYTDATGRTNSTATELGAGDISGMTLYPGLYKWSSGVLINNGITLDCKGNNNAVFIFQIAQELTVGNGAIITLSGSCQAKNIFWQVSQATLGTTSNFKGNILSQTDIDMQTGATLNGRALAQTAITLDANTITLA